MVVQVLTSNSNVDYKTLCFNEKYKRIHNNLIGLQYTVKHKILVCINISKLDIVKSKTLLGLNQTITSSEPRESLTNQRMYSQILRNSTLI